MTIFILVGSTIYLFLGLLRLRYAFFSYVGLLPFMPGYLAIPLGIGGAGISLRRIFTYLLLICIFAAFVRRPRKWLNLIRFLLTWRIFLLWLIMLYVAKLISTLMLNEPVGIFYWLDEVAEIAVALLLGIRFINNSQAIKFFFFVVTLSFMFCELIVLFENAVEHNLLQGLVTVEVSTVGENVLSGFQRDGEYRTMGLFDNPLSLSEFAVIGAIFSYGAYYLRCMKWLPWLTLLLTFPVILSTGARFGILTLFIILAVLGYMLLVEHFPLFRKPFRLLLVTAILSIFLLFIYAINNPEEFVNSASFLWGGGSADGSTIFRLLQYPLIFIAVLDKPLFGFGIKNHLIQDLNTPLDNYYLRVLIESGFVGLVAFVLMILFVAKFVTYGERLSQLPHDFGKRAYKIMTLYIICFLCIKLFLSMTFNNIYFYLICGSLIGLSAHRNQYHENNTCTQ